MTKRIVLGLMLGSAIASVLGVMAGGAIAGSCPDGTARNAVGTCDHGHISPAVLRSLVKGDLPKQSTIFVPPVPRRSVDVRASGRIGEDGRSKGTEHASGRIGGGRGKPTELNPSCNVPPGALPVCTQATEAEVEYWQNINGKAQSEGQNPEMGDREDVPPSAGAGSR